MSDFDEAALIRHVRGAIVVHQSPFSSIEVPNVEDGFSQAEVDQWVVPFYRVSIQRPETVFTKSLREVYSRITPAVVDRLLSEFDWRRRLTGAFFAALKRFTSFEDHIGRLLLRSDLCYAGRFYGVALAEFNTVNGVEYLRRYLTYYLTRPDLEFEQSEAMGAVAYLDAKNGTRHFESFEALWNAYSKAMSWQTDIRYAVDAFTDEMKALHECRALAEAGE